MAADIINLKRVRKQKARTEKDLAAQANRILHGTPKMLRETARARKNQVTGRLDGKKLDTMMDKGPPE